MSLEQKIQNMSSKYKELRTCEFPVVKKMIIGELRKLAAESRNIMCQYEQPSNSKYRRQIDDVLKKCDEIQKQLEGDAMKDIGGGGRQYNPNQKQLSQSEMAKIAVHSVIFHQIRTSQLKIRPEQYNQVYKRMCNNLEVMKEMEMMVKEQGNNLEKVDEYLQQAYSNAVQANQELTEANELQKQSRRMKFKLAISGFFAALGYKILGLPGMLLGLFAGSKAG